MAMLLRAAFVGTVAAIAFGSVLSGVGASVLYATWEIVDG